MVLDKNSSEKSYTIIHDCLLFLGRLQYWCKCLFIGSITLEGNELLIKSARTTRMFLTHLANVVAEDEDVKFGDGFGAITDMQVGPHDGYLYIVSYGRGEVYRIVPANAR